MFMAEPLQCSPETTTTLLMGKCQLVGHSVNREKVSSSVNREKVSLSVVSDSLRPHGL